MSARAAFAAHSRGGWRVVHQDDHGMLAPGAPATFAAWSVPEDRVTNGLPTLDPDDALPVCRRTVLRGTTIHEAQ